jgi:hypothetical protein
LQRAEERDRLQKEDDQELLKRIEQTHRGSSVFYAGGSTLLFDFSNFGSD